MSLAICVICYNRIAPLKRVLKSLEAAHYDAPIPLIISIDKSETTAIEDFVETYHWPHGTLKAIKHPHNLGLRAHVLEVGKLLNDYDALIVLEDDITVSPYYYQYACQTIAQYQDDERIAGISLYNFPVDYQNGLPFTPLQANADVYFMNCAQSWGQIWLKRQWQTFMTWYETHHDEFELDYLPQALNDWPKSSWLKYHTRYCIEENKYFVYPYQALSSNNNDAGTHVAQGETNIFASSLQVLPQKAYRLPALDEGIVKYDGFFSPTFLAHYLQLSEDDLTVDFWGKRKLQHVKRYLLTTRSLPFKVVNSFGLRYHPMETNIMLQEKGQEIYLYDTHTKGKKPKTIKPIMLLQYSYRFKILSLLKAIGIANLVMMVCKRWCKKLIK